MYSLRNVMVKGVAACVPSEIYQISEYPFFTEQEKKDFTKRVGIASKRHSQNKYTTSDLCLAAGKKLLSELNWATDEIGLLVLVTQSPDYLLPASSILLQSKLNLSNDTIAFDINLGCSGWVYGLSIVGGMMQALNIPKAILLAGETSVLADPNDKLTFPLMGDAGTATALMLSGNAPPMYFNLQSDGSGYEAIIAAESGSRYLSAQSKEERLVKYNARLDSQKVLEFCLKNVAPSIQSLMNFCTAGVNDVNYFVFHQANKIINESVRKRINIPAEKLPYSIQHFGNTSSASIPLTMVAQLKDELRSKRLSLLCSGFGVGLSLANVLLQTENISCPDLIEI